MAIAKPSLEKIASHLMFSGNRSVEEFNQILDTEGVEFRKSKGIDDITHAMAKAKSPRIGRGRVELEQNMLECYLDDILKLKKKISRT